MRAAALAIAALALGLGGCAAGGAPGEQVAITHDVTYYPACGNEVLEHEGTRWYPFTPANPEDFPAAQAWGSAAPGWARASAVRAVPVVVAPGPGDDTGTLTEYEGGFAFWVSDNGELDTWLTTAEMRYSWAC